MKYFVYIDGLRGPVPQIWHDEMQGRKPLFLHKLSADEDRLSLDELARIYPYTGSSDE